MSQFDVFRNRRSNEFPLLVDVQSDLHENLTTRLVLPLMARTPLTATRTRLTPVVNVLGSEYIVVTTLAAAVSRAGLGSPIGSLADQRPTLIAALDILITGS
ncbi:MAG TPA: CcdB family protein [Kofleriaceae bacterium]|jgi:toxin CcdB|nr:CcdB family protein [Kofleriaceae bacterium]